MGSSKQIQREAISYFRRRLTSDPFLFSLHFGGGAEINGEDAYVFYTLPYRRGREPFSRDTLFIYPSGQGKRISVISVRRDELEPGSGRVHNSQVVHSFKVDIGRNLALKIETARENAFRSLTA